jgi:hypothetical protein
MISRLEYSNEDYCKEIQINYVKHLRGPITYSFDHVFSPEKTQSEVFK